MEWLEEEVTNSESNNSILKLMTYGKMLGTIVVQDTSNVWNVCISLIRDIDFNSL